VRLRALLADSGSPWSVALYADERAEPAERAALADIFLGRAGGTTLAYFAQAIGEVHAVRAASIRLDHTAGRQRIQVDDYVAVRALEPVAVDEVVSWGSPGHDRPGTEMRTEVQRVDDPPLRWEVFGRCGFATDFAYNSDGGR
jgi:hypothetical protein